MTATKILSFVLFAIFVMAVFGVLEKYSPIKLKAA